MFRVFSGIILFCVGASILIWLLGYFQPENYSGELQEFFADRRPIIWQAMTDINSIPHIKNDVVNIEILEDNHGLLTWKENTKMGGYRIYQMVEKKNLLNILSI